MSVDVSAAENRARAAIRELRRDELRARKAERIRQRRQADPELRAREAELKRKRRAANLEARARHAERIRQRRQADPELRAREAESKRKRREVNLAAVRQREAEWKRKRRAADCEAARQRESAAKRLEQLLQPGTDVASAPFERHFLDRSFGHSCSLCDRLWFDNDVTKVGSIQNEQHWNAVAGVLRQELGTASSNDGNHVAVRGVLLKRCPCGQVVNTNDASQIPDWKVRRDVSIQCGLQEMAPLPLPTEIFSSAATVESIATRTSCYQAGIVPSEFENGMEHVTGSTVGGQQLFQCHRCQYSTSKHYRLTYHLQSHSTERPFQCEVCPAAFKRLHSYKAHMCIHTGEVLYQCHLCPYTTSYNTLMLDHKRAHSDTVFLACDMCAYTTKKKANLHMHKLNHIRDMPFKCKICSFGYNKKRYLKNHMRQHLES